MNTLLVKMVKKNNKKQGKNITLALMVAFLVGSVSTYANKTPNFIVGTQTETITIDKNGEHLINNGFISKNDGFGNSDSAMIIITGNNVIFENNGRVDGIEIQPDKNFQKDITIKNSGTISGTNQGIYTSGNVKLILDNLGVITGNGVGVQREDTPKGNINNFGVMAGHQAAGYLGYNGELKNYGIIITEGKDGRYYVDEVGENGIQNIEGKNYYILNMAKLSQSSLTDSISLELKGNTHYKDYIINGTDKTLKLSGNNNIIEGSVINAHRTAIQFTDEGGSIILNGSSINGGFIGVNDGNTFSNSVIAGGVGDDKIYAINSMINGHVNTGAGNDILSLDNTTVNGNINMGSGDDTLAISKGTILNGEVILGKEGDNTLAFLNKVGDSSDDNTFSYDEINAMISDKENKIQNVRNLKFADGIDNNIDIDKFNLKGKFYGGTGNDTFSLNSTIKGIYGGAGNDTFNLGSNANVGVLNGGEGSDTLNSDISLTDKISIIDIETLNLNKGGNNFTISGKGIEKINVSEGNNTFAINSDINNISVNVMGDNNKLIIGENNSTRALEEKKDYLSLNGTFNGFNNIDINTKTKLEANLTITSGSLNMNSDVVLGLDESKKDENGNIIGNALANSNVTVNNNSNNKVIVDTTDLTEDGTINIGNIVEGIGGKDNIQIGTDISKDWVVNDDGTISVAIKDVILEGYGDLDKITKALISSGYYGDILAGLEGQGQEAKQREELLKYTENLAYNSPYSYTNKISKKTAELVNESIMNGDFRAKKGEWIGYGKVLANGNELDDYYSSYINSKSNLDSDVYSSYIQAEYGQTENLALGFSVGGNKSDSDIGKSSIDGKGFYLGAYGKYNINKIDLTFGVGYQHNRYETTRVTENSIVSHSMDKKYSDDTLSGYLGAKYNYKISEELDLEPNLKLNLTHVMQDKIDEGIKENTPTLSLEDKDFTSVTSEIGIDIVRTKNISTGKMKIKAGIALVHSLEGNKTESINATMYKAKLGENSIQLATVKEDKTNTKLNFEVEYQKTSGTFYNGGINFLTSSKKDEYVVSLGAGYRF